MTTLPPPLTGEPTQRRRPAWLIRAVIAVAVAVIGIAAAAYALGRSSDTTATASTSSPSAAVTTGLPAAVQIECANIDRAHKAWTQGRAWLTSEDVAAAREIDVKMAMEDTSAYLRAVEGHDDQPSKALASAIAQYNLELSILNAALTITGEAGDDSATSVPVAGRKVHDQYTAWQNDTCV